MVYIGYEEEWKKIIVKNKYTTNYSVSNFGKIRNDKTGKILKPHKAGKYYLINIQYVNNEGKRKTYGSYISRLVAIAFIPIPERYRKLELDYNDLEVDHIRDGAWDNHDDNSIYNLQWLTHDENVEKAKNQGLYEKFNLKGTKQPDWNWMIGEDNANSIYDSKLVHKICKDIQKNELSMREIAEKYDVKYGFITDIKARKTWTHISCLYDFSKYNKRKNQYDTHTDDAREFLDKLIVSGATNSEIYRLMKLDPKKDCYWISKRRKNLNCSVSKRTKYDKDFIENLHKLILDGKSNKEIMKILNLESCQKTYNLLAIHRRKMDKL